MTAVSPGAVSPVEVLFLVLGLLSLGTGGHFGGKKMRQPVVIRLLWRALTPLAGETGRRLSPVLLLATKLSAAQAPPAPGLPVLLHRTLQELHPRAWHSGPFPTGVSGTLVSPACETENSAVFLRSLVGFRASWPRQP